MRRFTFITVMMFMFILLLTACDNSQNNGDSLQLPQTENRLSGKIVQMYNESLIIACTGVSELYTVSSGLAIYNINN